MKKALQFLLLFSILMMGITHEAEAQRKKKKKKDVDEYFDDKGSFIDRLWYGGGLNLGGGSSGNFSSFQFGLSPMVGYKLNDFVSFGPRISLDFNYLKGETISEAAALMGQAIPTGRQASWITSFSGGLFGRLKFLETLFIHGEMGYQKSKFASSANVGGGSFLLYNEDTDKLTTINDDRSNTYLGIGYNSGGGYIGYEILVLYDFNVAEDEQGLPFDIRVGFTYKF